jgi:hypothetical protein
MNIESAKQTGDLVSLGVVFATIADWLPSVAALLTIVWTGIRIWETRTVQQWVDRDTR